MMAAVKTAAAPGCVVWGEWEDLTPRAGQVVVEIDRAGICSTDVAIYDWDYRGRQPVVTPSVLGHEGMGHVSVLGEDVVDVGEGDRVALQVIWGHPQARESLLGWENLDPDWCHLGASELGGAFAEQVVIDATRIVRLPDTIATEDGALLEPVAVAAHAVEVANLRLGDRVCLVGPGPFGQIMCQIAKASGASAIVAVGLAGVDEARLEVAQQFAGVDDVVLHSGDVFATAREVKGHLAGGADVVFDCGGTCESLPLALEVADQGARIAVFGFASEARVEPLRQIIRKGLQLTGVSAASRRHYGQGLLMLSRGSISPACLVTHVLPMREVAQGIELIKKRVATKVALTKG